MNSADELLQEGIGLAAMGRHKEALTLFKRAVEKEPRNEVAWLWLAELVDDDEERIKCLEKVLDVNAKNQGAQERLASLRQPAAGAVHLEGEATRVLCSECGTDNPGDSRFCRGCGAPLLEQQGTQEEVTVTDAVPTAIQSTIGPVAQEDVTSVVRVTERRPSGMRHLAAPAAAVAATVVIYNRLAGLELIQAYGVTTPMMQAIFDPEAVSVLGVDMSAHLMLQCALLWVESFSVIWLLNAVVISIVDWARGRRRPD